MKGLILAGFGTTHQDTAEKTYNVLEDKVARAFKDYEIQFAYTSRKVKKILMERDNIVVPNVAEAIYNFHAKSITDIIIQSVHILKGFEYEKLLKFPYNIGSALLGSDLDIKNMANCLLECYPIKEKAIVYMGHGTDHSSDMMYERLEYELQKHNPSAYIGTIEGERDLDYILDTLKSQEDREIFLAPLMLVAGDHVKNDMLYNDDSWENKLKENGFRVSTSTRGLLEFECIQDLFINKIKGAINE